MAKIDSSRGFETAYREYEICGWLVVIILGSLLFEVDTDALFVTCNHIRFGLSNTLIERKSRMPHIRGGKGEAVVSYCEPLTTQEMG